MQLLRLSDVPLNQRDRVFYYSRLRAVAGAVILAAGATAALLFGRQTGLWLAYFVAAVAATCLLIFQKLVTARFRPSNWLVRMTDHGIFVKFRSYLNNHFPEQDATVVFVHYSEIRSARLLKERQELPDRDDRYRSTTTTRTRRLMELELTDNLTQFAEALGKERARVFAKSASGDHKLSTRYQHFPVQLASPALLRIEWGVVPDAQRFLDEITRHTLVRPAEKSSKDFVRLDGLTTAEQEAHLLELVESGDMIGAVAIARRLYSYDLTTAKGFVEGLVGKRSKA